MDRQDTIKILAVLKAAYPNFYKGMTKADLDGIVALWSELFADDDAALVAAAVKSLIASEVREFPPNISIVKEEMRKLTATDEMTDAEAWNMVAKAIRNGYYGAKEEFAKLPDTLKRIVGSPAQLKDWAVMDSEILHSVVASNVQKAYHIQKERDQSIAKLPSDIRLALGASNAFRLE